MEDTQTNRGIVNPVLSEVSLSVASDQNEPKELTKVSIRLNINYLKTPIGILTIAEMVRLANCTICKR